MSFSVYNAYSSHAVLFLFASSYFFKPVYATKDVFQFFKSEVKGTLLSYFKYTVFLIVLTILHSTHGNWSNWSCDSRHTIWFGIRYLPTASGNRIVYKSKRRRDYVLLSLSWVMTILIHHRIKTSAIYLTISLRSQESGFCSYSHWTRDSGIILSCIALFLKTNFHLSLSLSFFIVPIT